MRNLGNSVVAMLVFFGVTLHAESAGEGTGLGELALGLTEAQVLELYPAGEIALQETILSIEGRYADFKRDGQLYEQGLTMFKLVPTGLDTQEKCEAFFQQFKPFLSERYGDPADESATDQWGTLAWEASWKQPNEFVELSAMWAEERKLCAASIFFRPTNVERP